MLIPKLFAAAGACLGAAMIALLWSAGWDLMTPKQYWQWVLAPTGTAIIALVATAVALMIAGKD